MNAHCNQRNARGAASFIVLAVISVSALACGDARSRASEWRGSMDTLPNGTIIVRNPDAPVWDSAASWRLVEDLRIGTMNDSGPALFGEIGGVTQDSTGRVYVLDEQAQEIRVFAPDGSFVRTIGKRGSGPGEFNGAFGIVFDHADDLWTVDRSNARYQVFDHSGALLRTYRRPTGAVLYPFLGGVSEQGVLHDVFPNPVQPGVVHYVFAAFDTSVARFDSLPPLIFDRGARVPLSSMALFAVLPRLVFRFDGRGFLWFGLNDQYRIHQRSLSGDTVRIVEKVARRAELSSRERDAIVEDLRKTNSLDQQRIIPEQKPLFSRLLVDRSGFLYLMLAAAGPDAGTQFDVFDPAGRYLGQVAVPAALAAVPAPLIVADHLLAVAQDAEGVNYVVRYRIVRPNP